MAGLRKGIWGFFFFIFYGCFAPPEPLGAGRWFGEEGRAGFQLPTE